MKSVDGNAADKVDPDRTYSVTAAIDTSALGSSFPAQPDRRFTVKSGTPYTLTDLPIGAKVTLSETPPPNDDVLTWSAATISPATYIVTAAEATTPATISITNHVSRSVGTFSISKTVTGDQANNAAVPSMVTVNAAWNQEGTPGSTTLTLPTDGTSVPLGVDLLVGTTVTLTEVPLSDGHSIAWAAPVWSGTGVSLGADDTAQVVIGRDTTAHVSLEDHAATSTAGISLIKGIAGAAAGEVDPSTTFPVTATWKDADGQSQSKDITINALTPTKLGVQLPAGTVVTITEGKRPHIATVDWGAIQISGNNVTDNGDGSAQVVVSDQQGEETLVSVLNEADWAPGTFDITKTITGISTDDPDVPKTVQVRASWYDAASTQQLATLTLPTDGTVVPFGADLPYGTQITLTEIAPDNTARFTWDAPRWGGDATQQGDEATVIIGAATNANISLVNHATATLGTLALSKTVHGSGAAKVPAGTWYPFTVSWTDLLGKDQSVDVRVQPGTPTIVKDIPMGTHVTVKEGDANLPSGVAWKSVKWTSGDDAVTLSPNGESVTITVRGDRGSQATLTATNEIVDQPGLASTGSEVLPWILPAAALAIAGLVMLLLLRRRRA
ncbi:DUF5979 domain-containing protein [Humibacter albus]|uniref:DUF5979 domain-containing protein n=1 Tax=Humibacter albus TaxID=427754 RepID=UPI0012FCAF0A|nr:DUF5979 domain-containing protein [Humibacter albus]